MSNRLWVLAIGTLAAVLLSGCGGGGSTSPVAMGNSPAEKLRAAQIAGEPRGDYYIGRRYWVDRTRFWGYLRRPGEYWETARLVVMNESRKHTPDRFPERPVGAEERFSFDHNYEYRIYGYYSGREIYDPNANLFLPEFVLTNYQLIDANPGWLFRPNEVNTSYKLPWVPKH